MTSPPALARKRELSARNSCSPSRDGEEAESRQRSAGSQGRCCVGPNQSGQTWTQGSPAVGIVGGVVTQGGVGVVPTAARADVKTLTTLRLQTQPSRASGAARPYTSPQGLLYDCKTLEGSSNAEGSSDINNTDDDCQQVRAFSRRTTSPTVVLGAHQALHKNLEC